MGYSGVKETVVSTAERQYDEDVSSAGDTKISRWLLGLGDNHRPVHVSWKVDKSAEVQHLVRVVLKSKWTALTEALPDFQYDRVVTLTSDPWVDLATTSQASLHLPSISLAPANLIPKPT